MIQTILQRMASSPILRPLLLKFIPKRVFDKLILLFTKLRTRGIRSILDQSTVTPAWLGLDVLKSLQDEYPFSTSYGRDPQSQEKRGRDRAGEILRLVKDRADTMNSFLELGCWDGMTSYFLKRHGKMATAIDIRADGFDERAASEGAKFLQMDAAHLRFDDETFDFVFSYNAFEHFPEPELVLQEAVRVVRKGGYIYLVFGPLYMSPKGSHGYRSITVPYHQLLFPKELLEDFTRTRGLSPVTLNELNKWSVEDYRGLWNRYSHKLRKVRYRETYNPLHMDLIARFPSCFKSKTTCLDNLLVSDIEALFERIR
ncbi:methyltransferase domain-containing protein [Candidatus Poribacteria bacterium]|nr:methyltransferase domain-containing protein [Candidatus Poribacteria bacterium]